MKCFYRKDQKKYNDYSIQVNTCTDNGYQNWWYCG